MEERKVIHVKVYNREVGITERSIFYMLLPSESFEKKYRIFSHFYTLEYSQDHVVDYRETK